MREGSGTEIKSFGPRFNGKGAEGERTFLRSNLLSEKVQAR
jgi:hypothetical protein